MNDKWKLAKKLFRENRLEGIIGMKCSTSFQNPRASNSSDGIIFRRRTKNNADWTNHSTRIYGLK